LFEGREPFLVSLYLGLPTLALVAAAFAGPAARARAVFATVVIAGVLVALGRHAPFYDVAVALLPPLKILRYPVKVLVPVALAWAFLAGLGWDAWARAGAVARRRWALGVIAPAAAVALLAGAGAVAAIAAAGPIRAALLAPDVNETAAGAALWRSASHLAIAAALGIVAASLAAVRLHRPQAARATAAVLGVLAVGDLVLAHRNLQPVAPPALFGHRPEVVEVLARIPHERIYAYDYTRPDALARLGRGEGSPLARAPEGWPLEAALALAMQMHLAPATAGRWAIRSGYDIDYRGLYPPDLRRMSLLLRAMEGRPAHTRLLRLAGITHVVSLHAQGFEELGRVGEWPGLLREPTLLLSVPGPLPRTYAVGGARVAEGTEAFRVLVDDLSPAREVLLSSGAPMASPAGFQGTSRVVADAPDRVVLEAALATSGYVVLLDGFAAGWRAYVDGRPAPVLRANVAFRAVQVPAGRHTIEYVYRPPWMLAGLAVSAAAALAGAAFGLNAVRGGRPA
jgi:hypothetical protein